MKLKLTFALLISTACSVFAGEDCNYRLNDEKLCHDLRVSSQNCDQVLEQAKATMALKNFVFSDDSKNIISSREIFYESSRRDFEGLTGFGYGLSTIELRLSSPDDDEEILAKATLTVEESAVVTNRYKFREGYFPFKGLGLRKKLKSVDKLFKKIELCAH